MPVEQVPSVAELRARQLAVTTDAVRGARWAPRTCDRFDAVLDELTTVGDVRDVARAALKVAHEARTSEADEVEIPAFVPARAALGARRATAASGARAPGKPGGRFQGPGTKTRLFINLGRRDRSARATSSAPSPTSPTSPARTSARSTSPTTSPPSTSRPPPPTP